MELPQISSKPSQSPDALVRALKRADVILARTAAQETVLNGATAFVNTNRPGLRSVNCAFDLHSSVETPAVAVLAEIQEHFAAAGVLCHRLACAQATWPDDLVQAAAAHGYTRQGPSLLYALSHVATPSGKAKVVQIIPARAGYQEVRQVQERSALAESWSNAELASQWADTHLDMLDEPRLEGFLARRNGTGAGVITILSLGNIGVIHDLVVDPDHRHQGVGQALMVYALEHCARSLFEQVILEVFPDNQIARRLYESVGFHEIAQMKWLCRANSPVSPLP